MRADAKIKNVEEPYIYTYFNVSAFYQASNGTAEGSLHRIHNAVIEGINKNEKLPRFIIITPDSDLITHGDFFTYGVKIIYDEMIYWLMKKIEKALTTRKEDLRSKCLGAVGHDPRVIWVKMISHPYIKNHPVRNYNETVKLRQKYNDSLDSMAAKMRHTHVIEHPYGYFNSFYDYDHLGRLTYKGKQQFWRHIDNEFKKYDRNEIDLLPVEKQRKHKDPKTKHSRRQLNF